MRKTLTVIGASLFASHAQTALQMALELQGMPFIAIRRMFKHWVMSLQAS